MQIGSALSSFKHLKYSVLQGSVLGYLLFTLYMLPLANILVKRGAKCQCFADDTQLYLSCKSTIGDTKLRLQKRTAQLSTWLADNHLRMIAVKSEHMLVHPNRMSAQDLPVPIISGDGSET